MTWPEFVKSINDNSGLLSKIGGWAAAAITLLTTVYIRLSGVWQTRKDKKFEKNVGEQIASLAAAEKAQSAIAELSRKSQEAVLDLEKRLRAEMQRRTTITRRIQLTTWVTFFILLTTLWLYTTAANNRLVSEEARLASLEAYRTAQRDKQEKSKDNPVNAGRATNSTWGGHTNRGRNAKLNNAKTTVPTHAEKNPAPPPATPQETPTPAPTPQDRER